MEECKLQITNAFPKSQNEFVEFSVELILERRQPKPAPKPACQPAGGTCCGTGSMELRPAPRPQLRPPAAAHLEQFGLVGVAPGVGAEAGRMGRLLHMGRERVRVCVHRDGGHAQPGAGPDHAARYLAAVSDQHRAICVACAASHGGAQTGGITLDGATGLPFVRMALEPATCTEQSVPCESMPGPRAPCVAVIST